MTNRKAALGWGLAGVLVLSAEAWAASAVSPRLAAQQNARDALRLTGLPGGVFEVRQGPLSRRFGLRALVNGCTSVTYDPLSPNFEGFDAPLPDDSLQPRVIDLVRKGGQWYLTFQIDAPPNCNVEGQCGAGLNTSLIWLKLSPSLELRGKQAEIVEECQTNTSVTAYTGFGDGRQDPSFGPVLELRGGKLQLTRSTSSYSGGAGGTTVETVKNQTITYSRATPERGLQVGAVKVVRK